MAKARRQEISERDIRGASLSSTLATFESVPILQVQDMNHRCFLDIPLSTLLLLQLRLLLRVVVHLVAKGRLRASLHGRGALLLQLVLRLFNLLVRVLTLGIAAKLFLILAEDIISLLLVGSSSIFRGLGLPVRHN